MNSMVRCFYFFIAVLSMGCQSHPSQGSVSQAGVAGRDTSGFLLNCPKWASGMSGYIQGVAASRDSLGPFCMYECYDCKETFEIVFAYKDFEQRQKVSEDSIWHDWQHGCANGFKDFQCFAFVYPMRDPDKQKDANVLNMDFPLTVRIFKRTEMDRWEHLGTSRVGTFEQLSRLRLNTIYGLK